MMREALSLREHGRLSRYLVFSREEWAHLRDTTPLALSEESLRALRSLNDPISLQEVEQIYLPLSHLLQLYLRRGRSEAVYCYLYDIVPD
jgi:type I pantothenate kinase